jgi:hypothetical protein
VSVLSFLADVSDTSDIQVEEHTALPLPFVVAAGVIAARFGVDGEEEGTPSEECGDGEFHLGLCFEVG